MSTNEQKHELLLQQAIELSAALHRAIELNGPLAAVERPAEPFPQVLCRSVAGQQLSVQAARTIWSRVLALLGDGPVIDAIPQHDVEALRECGLSRAKAKTLHAIAAAVANDELQVERLGQLSSVERQQQLTAIWGVGPWTADMMNIFYFADPDIWPDGDVTARSTLTKLTSPRRKTIRSAERFKPYRSLLARHMWKAADTKVL